MLALLSVASILVLSCSSAASILVMNPVLSVLAPVCNVVREQLKASSCEISVFASRGYGMNPNLPPGVVVFLSLPADTAYSPDLLLPLQRASGLPIATDDSQLLSTVTGDTLLLVIINPYFIPEPMTDNLFKRAFDSVGQCAPLSDDIIYAVGTPFAHTLLPGHGFNQGGLHVLRYSSQPGSNQSTHLQQRMMDPLTFYLLTIFPSGLYVYINSWLPQAFRVSGGPYTFARIKDYRHQRLITANPVIRYNLSQSASTPLQFLPRFHTEPFFDFTMALNSAIISLSVVLAVAVRKYRGAT